MNINLQPKNVAGQSWPLWPLWLYAS